MNQSIPILKIGGKPVRGAYGISYSIGGTDSPSTLTVDYVNESGVYEWPEFNTKNPVKIKFDNIEFSGFPVRAETRRSANGGKTFQVKYIDTSNILDKIYIGLKGKYGPGFTTKFSGELHDVILVGDEIDPCENRNETEIPDPCAPDCESPSGTSRQPYNCIEERLIKILEVNYSFNDLRYAVSNRVKFGNFPVDVDDSYRAKYTGTLRSVLKSWCDDYGLTFYWDASTNSVFFVDLKTGININDENIVNAACEISDYNESRSIEDNVEFGNITYFGGEGDRRDYECQINPTQRITLKQITLKDLFIDEKGNVARWLNNIYGAGYDGETLISRFESACALSYYSTVLRDLTFFYNVYDIEDVTKARAAIGTRMTPLGNLTIRKVLDKDAVDPKEKTAFQILVQRMSADEGKDFLERGGYFIIADYDQNVHDKILNLERGLAEQFIGRYWFDRFGGGRYYSFSAPEGTPQYYENGNEFSLPFFDDLPEGAEAASYYMDNVLPVDETGRTRGSFILLDRQATWVPARESEPVEKLMEDIGKIEMTIESFEDIGAFNFIGEGQAIFKVFPKPETFSFENLPEGINSQDAQNVNVPTTAADYSTVYGLRSAECRRWRIKTKSTNFVIEFPTQAHIIGNNTVDGYVILASRANFVSRHSVILPKLEYVLGNVGEQSSKSVGLSINYRDATQNVLSVIQRLQDGSCGYDEAQILQILQDYNSRFFSHADFEKITKTYEIIGLPARRVTVRDGLESLSIAIGDNGCTSTISFSNLPRTPKSEQLALNDFDKDRYYKLDRIDAIRNRAKDYYKR